MNLSTEMRQLDEQYVPLPFPPYRIPLTHLGRFTSYDFRRMKRRSYYPTNQQLISSITQTSSNQGGHVSLSRSGTPVSAANEPGPAYDTSSINPPPPIPGTKMIPMEVEDAVGEAR